ncbi:MAG: DRTGG domain-containing protein [Synergistales bacterium]|nr:DRTGG domain-containing protein [Synergistales bacterium]
MKVQKLAELLGAKVLCGAEKLETAEVDYVYAADLMSDVLAFALPGTLLLTGLTNIQIIRTAQMLDLPAILFVRGKHPQEETVRLASQVGLPLLISDKSMYETSGIIFQAGVAPCPIPERGE